jgi:hypothetical protein
MPPRVLGALGDLAEGHFERIGQLGRPELAAPPLLGKAFTKALLLGRQRRPPQQHEGERPISIRLPLHDLGCGPQDVQQTLRSTGLCAAAARTAAMATSESMVKASYAPTLLLERLRRATYPLRAPWR